MAHPKSKRMALRSAYIFRCLTLEQAAASVGVSVTTAARWKREAKEGEERDDWDMVRAASSLAGQGMESIARQMLCDYVIQHKALMEQIGTGTDITAGQKVDMLSSLADSFSKTIAASKRVLPETDTLATVLDVIRALSDFIMAHYATHAPVFVEILEAFQDEMVKRYSS